MRKKLTIGLVLLAAFILFTVLVKTVDVKPIGRQGTDVGMATVNEWFNGLTAYHETLYKVTEYVGYLAFAVIGAFGLLGLKQLIERRSLIKVDRDILLLGGFYVVVLACYVLFEKLVINYRPIYAGEEELEASYPSSHTLLFVAVMTTAVMQLIVRARGTVYEKVMMCLFTAAGLFMVVGRAFCGVHWLTDILGGMLLAAALVSVYAALAFPDGIRKPDGKYPHGNNLNRFGGVYAGPPINCVYAGPEMFEKESEK
ncbi:MAG: phosphatase PAP2 family protein [Lachnospiraceae bacterium]|nr:phosphatase PAP2 family protein [Lachnospiraceae bacterium]